MSTRGERSFGVSGAPPLTRAGRVTATVVGVIAALVLTLWVVDSAALAATSPRSATEGVVPAAGFVGLAVAMWLVGRRSVWVPLALVTGLSVVLVLWYAVPDLRSGSSLVPEGSTGRPPRRPAVATVVCLPLLSVSVATLHLGRCRLTEAVLALPAIAGTVAALAYLEGADELAGIGLRSSMSVSTTVSVLLLSVAVALSVPGGHLSWMLTSPGPGAVALRRIVPVALVGFPLLGAAVLAGEDAGLYTSRFRLVLVLAVTILTAVVAAVGLARRLEELDGQRQDALDDLARLNARLAERSEQEAARAENLSQDLARQRERFGRALTHIEDVVWTVEVTEDRGSALRYASSSLQELLGGEIPRGADVGAALQRLVGPGERERVDGFFARVRLGLPADTELELVSGDGTRRTLWVRGFPWREGSRLLCDGIVTDVTARREEKERRERLLSLERRRVRELREVDRLRDEFLAVTGHELRTPLTSIRGYAELLAESDLSGAHLRYVDVIVRRSRQMSELVEDLYDLSRLSAGILTLHPEHLDLDGLVSEVVEAHREVAEEARVHIGGGSEVGRVHADPVRLRQVLDNLVSNAIKYNRPGGTVTVTASSVGDRAVIEVGDDGVGIPDEERHRVFDRLFRGESARAGESEGTGLGLHLTRVLVEAHEGHIAVRGNDGPGSTFVVELPVGDPPLGG